ncbi:ribonuclease H, partial [Proteus mirabilis]|nr:ribonuclease H [Proteus mirabilis]
NELEGKLSFVDQIDRFNNKDILSKGGVLLKNRRENLYSKFIYFKKFIFNDEVTVITEGHTDHIYIRSAAISRKDKFNDLIKEDNKKIKLNFSFLKINNKIEYLLDVREGTSSIK